MKTCCEEVREMEPRPTRGITYWLGRIIAIPFMLLIRFYQLVISPWLGPRCRFQPTCSQYGLEAFRRHNPVRALYLTCRRIARCHPWGGHGYDPVP